jgi:hypothetical protein
MGYMHIENLYKNTAILNFKEVYALEKIHGTSAHISWRDGQIKYSSGGEKFERFIALFDSEKLAIHFMERFGPQRVVIYGEAYGGKLQGMRDTYGGDLKFVVFDIAVGDVWLDVPSAEMVAREFGLEFVSYVKTTTDVEALNVARDQPSVQAQRNGIVEPKIREGVVLRPLFECSMADGTRVIAKHKSDKFAERKTTPEIGESTVLQDAKAIADEWVVDNRLSHVLDKLGNPTSIEATGDVIKAMVEDVLREASGEIVDSREVRKAISSASAKMFKKRISLF